MRIPRIYHPAHTYSGEEVILSAGASQHLLRVLRLQPGAFLRLFDGQAEEYEAQLVKIHKNLAVVKINNVLPHQNVESPLRIHLGQGISRGEKMDYTIQKAVELGVHQITPLFTQYCEVKLTPERLQKRLQHWQSVIISACEQCGRTVLPQIHSPQPLSDWIKQCTETVKLIFHPHSNKHFADLPKQMSDVAILVGPEGGLSEQEITLGERNAFLKLSLGPRILRTETAALTAIAVLQSKWGDFL